MAFTNSTTHSSLRFTQPLGSTKPAWFYELLPFIYILAGTLVALMLSGALAIFSGVLLIATGVRVLWMRRHYRKTTKRRYQVPLQSRR